MIAIFKREFRSFFTNVIGWIFMAAILMLYGLYFYVYNLQSAYPYVSYTLSGIAFLIILLVPVLTMRSLAEDRRTKTDQLLLTAPISIFKIVFAKYIAMVAIYTCVMAVISLTPLVLSLYGTVPFGESYTAILGFWLYGITCIAIGEFVSSLTESQIIAAVISFAILFLGYMMNGICSLLSVGGNVLTKILGCYDLYSHLGPFMAGTLDVSSIVYYASVISLVLFLTTQVIQKRRWSISAKRIGTGVFSVASIILAFAICVGVNLGVSKIPTEYTSIDVTYSKLFLLTDATKEYVKNLDQDINIYVWVSETEADTTLKETLARYEDLSSHLRVRYISPSESPDFYTTYTDVAPGINSLFVVSDLRNKIINYSDIYKTSMDYNTYSEAIDGYDAEGQITSALEYVTMDGEVLPNVYVLDGHGEQLIGEKFLQALSKANVNYKTLTLLKEEAVPEDCQLLIINGPQSDLSKDDISKLRVYLEEGGDVLVTTSYDSGSLANLESLFAVYGIEKLPGIIMENDPQYAYANTPYFLLPYVEECAYTSKVTNGYIFAPYASGLKVDTENMDYEYSYIMSTTDVAVSKTDTANATTSEYEEGDIEGPFCIALSAMKADEIGNLIVVGSIDVFTDEADEIVAGSNVEFFTGIVAGTVSQGDLNLPVIDSKPYTVDNLVITTAVGAVVGILIMVIIPIMLVVTGIIIWNIRRKL